MSGNDEAGSSGPPPAPTPHPKLRDLDILEGTWRLDTHPAATSEPSAGTVIRRWLPGNFFMTQETRHGDVSEGIEYIGYDSAADSLRSMLFSGEGPGPFCPFALEYFWDVDGDQLTIWHGYRDSPARFSGTIDRTYGVIRGAWHWPGGGYAVTATRIV